MSRGRDAERSMHVSMYGEYPRDRRDSPYERSSYERIERRVIQEASEGTRGNDDDDASDDRYPQGQVQTTARGEPLSYHGATPKAKPMVVHCQLAEAAPLCIRHRTTRTTICIHAYILYIVYDT